MTNVFAKIKRAPKKSERIMEFLQNSTIKKNLRLNECHAREREKNKMKEMQITIELKQRMCDEQILFH